MSNLIDHAQRELKAAGLFDKDAPYDGQTATDALVLIEVLARQGHSGGSLDHTLTLFNRLARFQLLAPMKNPMENGDYIDHTGISGGNPTFQSTYKSSVFSEDGGKSWYDLNKRVPWWKRWAGVQRSYITFPHL